MRHAPQRWVREASNQDTSAERTTKRQLEGIFGAGIGTGAAQNAFIMCRLPIANHRMHIQAH